MQHSIRLDDGTTVDADQLTTALARFGEAIGDLWEAIVVAAQGFVQAVITWIKQLRLDRNWRRIIRYIRRQNRLQRSRERLAARLRRKQVQRRLCK